jgi:hypothetical protein
MDNGLYYRIQMKTAAFGQIVDLIICTLQSFDEPDYDAELWFTEQKFETRRAAQAFIDDVVALGFPMRRRVDSGAGRSDV